MTASQQQVAVTESHSAFCNHLPTYFSTDTHTKKTIIDDCFFTKARSFTITSEMILAQIVIVRYTITSRPRTVAVPLFSHRMGNPYQPAGLLGFVDAYDGFSDCRQYSKSRRMRIIDLYLLPSHRGYFFTEMSFRLDLSLKLV